jgi:pimeloyl-ACP methyl ester carboxylesterase
VIAVDHIGVGDSSIPDLDSITFDHLAANHATVREALRLVAAGQLAAGLPRIRPKLVVGIGQSMGGCIGIIQQARHLSFDALAVLGYSGARMHLPEPPPGQDMLRSAFHWDEEPASLVEADLGGAPQPWRSPTMPSCVPTMAWSGLVVTEAATVDVPLFLAVGQRDVIEDLHTEPDAFRSSDDITLFRLRRAAHIHNFAATRMVRWHRLEAWITALEAAVTPAR